MAHPVNQSDPRLLRLLNQTEEQLRLDLRTLQNALIAKERKSMKAPIQNDNDFRERLTHIKKAYKQAAFDPDLRTAATELHKYLSSIKKQDAYDYWKARTLLYELNEVFSIDAHIKKEAANDGLILVDELRSRS